MRTLSADRFAFHLKRIREVQNLTQEELSAKTGLKATAISHFETGNRLPSLKNLIRIAAALNVELEWLLMTK